MNALFCFHERHLETSILCGAVLGTCVPAAMTGYVVAKHNDPGAIPIGVLGCMFGCLIGGICGYAAPFTVPVGAAGVTAYYYTRATTTRKVE